MVGEVERGGGVFDRPYFGGRILNLLQMITGELEGRSGKSVRVSELRRWACCGPSRPPACLCGFLSYWRFTGYERMEKKKKHPQGSQQEVPAPRIKVCSGSHCDVWPARPAPSAGSSFLPYILFDYLVVSQAHTSQNFGPNVQNIYSGVEYISFCAFLTLLLTVNLDVVFGILTDTIQATGLQLTRLEIKLTSLKVALIASDSLSLL